MSPESRRKQSRDWYKRHREEVLQKRRAYHAAKKQERNERKKQLYHERRQEWLKANGPCKWMVNGVPCGSWEDLEVDHINPKKKVEKKFFTLGRKRRERELKKCQPLCYEHHREKTNVIDKWVVD